MHTVTLEEAKANLDDLVAEVSQGAEIVITKDDKPVATLAAAPETPVEHRAAAKFPLFGLLKGQIEYAPDFDEPLEDFKPYME
jgi:prevent-host-death family protein